MDLKIFRLQTILLIVFVFVISVVVGWYGQKAVEKFFSNSKVNQVQSI